MAESSQIAPNLSTWESGVVGRVSLTTIFSPPPSCLSTVTYDGTSFWQGGLLQTGDQDCYPPSFTDIFNTLYNPGICPSGWTSVANPNNVGPATLKNGVLATRAYCCPSVGGVQFNLDRKMPLLTMIQGYYHSSTNRGLLRNACASLFGSPLTNVYYTPTRAEGPIPSDPSLLTIDPRSVEANTVYADIIQIQWASTDSGILRLMSQTTSSSSSEAQATAAQTAHQTAANAAQTASPPVTATAAADGLSSGAKAGIGIGAAVGAVALALLAYFLWSRRRQQPQRQRQQEQQQQQPYADNGTAGIAGNKYSTAGEWPRAQEKFSPRYDPAELPSEAATQELPSEAAQELSYDGARAELGSDAGTRYNTLSGTRSVGANTLPVLPSFLHNWQKVVAVIGQRSVVNSVVARFRPPNKAEIASGGETIVDFETEDTCHINSREAAGAFTFDRVFDTRSRQTDVFDFSIRSTVDDILNGYNGTVFAYGQTGAGKSYTMMGADIDDQEQKGIIPRIVEQMFESILRSPGNIEYTVRVSYMEIYMERIRDLLVPQNDNLPVHEEKSRGVYVKGLLEIYVSSVQEVYEVMRRGGSARATAATNMNQESSRSHSIFVITITQKNVETGSAKSGQLFLVDLAGSEKVGKTGATGQTLEEAKKINKSLSALGMVINSLTDGKSTHIPYRDSKLTRILQESLGGNSRTTLIVNCSPSSYNDAETISTLRFGVRAKAIKNKAKINAELSPLELKQLLKKAQNQVITYEVYVTRLEGEVQQWRSGDTVPREWWAAPLASDAVTGTKADSRAQRPATPSRLPTDFARSETPSRSDSRVGDRSSTPSLVLEKDEREEFLRRENDFQDQLAEKESQVSTAEKALQEAKEELQTLKEGSARSSKDNERLGTEVNELKMQLERVYFEGKEATITMDGLKEANSELTAELDEVKQQLLDVRISAKETHAVLDEKERKKAERMAQMMSGFDLGSESFTDNERKLQQSLELVDRLYDASAAGESIVLADLEDLRRQLSEAQGVVKQAGVSLHAHVENGDDRARRRDLLEERLRQVEQQYEALLEQNLAEADVEEIKDRLAATYAGSRETQGQVVKEMRDELEQKDEENRRLKVGLDSLRRQSKTYTPNGNGSPSPQIKTVQQQIADFDVMKKSLMRDLQNRCERVVELEISLDETREQYNNVLRSSNNRAQQKKMAFLEHNLEQLMYVQRQLVEQNGSLKKEVAIAERKLYARNERIMSLEALLQDSQDKLTAANHRFEAQLSQVKDRLEMAKQSSTKNLSQGGAGGGGTNGPGFSFGGAGSRIAKPLRGGGGAFDYANGGAGPNLPFISSLQNQEASPGGGGGGGGGGKRSSWFFNKHKD
ncbi:MAG: hypothetical protein LQ348_006085 [Seirophora lacunosa]|nr:MAG: hypothetical protein LQ348_006085 [Seirophora lacunosa]